MAAALISLFADPNGLLSMGGTITLLIFLEENWNFFCTERSDKFLTQIVQNVGLIE